jgi:hypothetical protein
MKNKMDFEIFEILFLFLLGSGPFYSTSRGFLKIKISHIKSGKVQKNYRVETPFFQLSSKIQHLNLQIFE